MRGSLRSILILYIVLAILLQLVGVWTLFFSGRKTSIDTAYAYREQVMDDSCEGLNQMFRRKEQAALELTYDEQVRTYARATHAKRYQTYMLLSKLIVNALIDDTLVGARLAFVGGTGLSFGTYLPLSLPSKAAERFLTPVYEPLKVYDGRIFGRSTLYYLVYRLPLIDATYPQKEDYRGALYVLYDTEKLMGAAFGDQPWALYAEGGALLNSSGFPEGLVTEAIAQGEESIALDGRKMHLLSRENEKMGAVIVSLFDDQLLTRDSETALRWALMISVLIMVSSAVVSVALYHSLLAPVAGVVRQLEVIGSKRGSRPLVTDSACRELNTLTKEINGMIDRLHAHAEKEMSMQQALYRADMQRVNERTLYLQSQINPHFLYNNLECMRGMASQGNEAAVRAMCTAMAEVYRYGTRGRRLTVTLRDEIGCLKRYFDIVRLRFGEEYTLAVDVPEEYLDTPIPRMTLQPLAENAVLHGLSAADRERARVAVRVRRAGGALTFCMEDNGAGMEQEALAALNRELRESKSEDLLSSDNDRIGVLNIHCRLRLLLGEGCGLTYESLPEGGLRAVLTLRVPA